MGSGVCPCPTYSATSVPSSLVSGAPSTGPCCTGALRVYLRLTLGSEGASVGASWTATARRLSISHSPVAVSTSSDWPDRLPTVYWIFTVLCASLLGVAPVCGYGMRPWNGARNRWQRHPARHCAPRDTAYRPSEARHGPAGLGSGRPRWPGRCSAARVSGTGDHRPVAVELAERPNPVAGSDDALSGSPTPWRLLGPGTRNSPAAGSCEAVSWCCAVVG